jgi:DNA-binding NtrC family response regulator
MVHPLHQLTTAPLQLQPFKVARRQTLDAFERSYLLELIEHHDSLAAMSRASGVTRKHLRMLLAKHGLRDQVHNRRADRP